MTPERWRQIDKLLETALEHEAGQRAAFLEKACAGDEALRREVEALLQAHEQAGSFIETPALEVAAQAGKPPESLVGRSLGHYEILSLLGAGGMGVVYRARDKHLERFVAIKVLPPEMVADPERKRRFVQEAKAASALNHSHIVTIYDIAQDSGVDYIAMEYVPGKTLEQLIPHKGMRQGEALQIAIQIADALSAAHAAGIIHRDLKPANVIVNENAQAKVLDFGLAKLVHRNEQSETGETQSESLLKTEEGIILGTAPYMSPEHIEGKKVDARSDIFSFGAVLYEMVTGQKAFAGDSRMSVLTAILHKDPKPASEIAKGIPRDLEKLISRCLRKDPDRRVQHMGDVKLALQDLVEELEVSRVSEAPLSHRHRRWMWTLAILAVLGVAATAFWVLHITTRLPQTPLTIVPITSYPGWEGMPSLSPDGHQLAFSWNGEKQNNFDIYVKLIGNPGQFRLTDHPRDDRSPSWSPDGRWIAFLRDSGEQKETVLLKPPIGGQERPLAEITNPESGTFWHGSLAWSPDGKWLVAPDRVSPGPFGLVSISIESGEKRKLTSNPKQSQADASPAISPDGRTLAFSRYTNDIAAEIYLLELSGDLVPRGEPRRLTFLNRRSYGPVWMPDGREIVFVSGPQHRPGLWRIAASGASVPERIPIALEGAYHPAVSRQGNRLVYGIYVLQVSIWRVEIPASNGKANPPTNLISSTRLEHTPRFSPDGKKIAFASYRSGSPEIWVGDSDGLNLVQLTSFGGPETTLPFWSPDGTRVVFDSNPEGTGEVYVVGAQGGKPVQLTHDPANDGAPSWSRDGRWIYFHSDRNGQLQVWKMPAEGGEPVQITKNGGENPVESMDGTSIYYLKHNGDAGALWKVPVKGGEERQVLDSVYAINFAVAKEGIYFIPLPVTANNLSYSIHFLSFVTGKTKPVTSLPGWPMWGFSLSPDERWILYAQVDQHGSDLMLVENFR